MNGSRLQRVWFGTAMILMEQRFEAGVRATDRLVDLVPATRTRPLRFSQEQHAEHCRIAECAHAARFSEHAQYWCARCYAVAEDGFTTEMVRSKFGPGLS